MEYYAYTVKILRSPKQATSNDYNVFFKHLAEYSTLWEKHCEITNDVIHYHGVIAVHPYLYRKKLRMKNFHLYLKRIYDWQGWVNYCCKQELTPPVSIPDLWGINLFDLHKRNCENWFRKYPNAIVLGCQESLGKLEEKKDQNSLDESKE